MFYLIVFILAHAQTTRRIKHPELMSNQAGCTNWVGGLEGSNDSTARIQFQLCPDGDSITGKMQWSSLVSGWSVRSIVGAWDTSHTQLTLRDVQLLEDRPELGWTFCTVDEYKLTIQGSSMTGTYRSAACDDQATLHLKLVQDNSEKMAVPSLESEEKDSSYFGCMGAILGKRVLNIWFVGFLFCLIRRR